MRRSEIIEGVDNLVNAIEETKLLEAFDQIVRSERAGTPAPQGQLNLAKSVLLRALTNFAIRALSFSEVEHKILKIFKLNTLSTPNLFPSLFFEEKPREQLIILWRTLDRMLAFLPSFLTLIQNESASFEEGKVRGKGLLTVILPEEREISTPERLTHVLEAISKFYEVFAVINKGDLKGLAVLSADSGSDKSFDFVGAAQIMSEVRKLLIAFWDRIVFFREKKAHEKIELIANSLPVLEKLAQNAERWLPCAGTVRVT